MPSTEQKNRKTRERILLAACEIFARKGFRSTTIRDICQKAHVNVAAVNYHFGSKDALYEAVCRHACGLNEGNPDPTFPVNREAGPEEKLRMFVHAFLNTILGQDRSAWMGMIMGREMVDPTRALGMVTESMIRPRLNQMQAIVRELTGDGANEEVVWRCCLSIAGQCLYYRFCQPVIRQLNPSITFDKHQIEVLTDHITRFSLNAVKELAGEAGRKAK